MISWQICVANGLRSVWWKFDASELLLQGILGLYKCVPSLNLLPGSKYCNPCKFEILMFPLETYTSIRIFRLTLFSGLILQKRIVWYSHFIWCNLQENSLQKSRNLVRGFVIFVGHLCRITRSTKLTVLHLLLGGWGRVGFVGGREYK